jgi:hypothetical protein
MKWKRAEQGALKSLTEDYKKYITPLVQFVMPKPEDNDQFEDIVERFRNRLLEIPNKLIEIWGTLPVFVDVSLLFTTPLKAESLRVITQKGNDLGGTFIPVIYLYDDKDIKKEAFLSAQKNKTGLCLRLIYSDFSDQDKLNQDISDLVLLSKLKEKDIDLLVDIKETGENGDKYAKYVNLSQNICNLKDWRTFTFASGSFPEDLTECRIDIDNLIPRIDWMCWKKNYSSKLKRMPSFSDYTIQHPIYKEAVQFFHPTSSIKYTLENDWFIMKGRKQKFGDYLASAADLIKSERFYGESFSDGDRYISDKAKHFLAYIKNPKIKGTGSTETWLKASINHHLTLVANQIANLP